MKKVLFLLPVVLVLIVLGVVFLPTLLNKSVEVELVVSALDLDQTQRINDFHLRIDSEASREPPDQFGQITVSGKYPKDHRIKVEAVPASRTDLVYEPAFVSVQQAVDKGGRYELQFTPLPPPDEIQVVVQVVDQDRLPVPDVYFQAGGKKQGPTDGQGIFRLRVKRDEQVKVAPQGSAKFDPASDTASLQKSSLTFTMLASQQQQTAQAESNVEMVDVSFASDTPGTLVIGGKDKGKVKPGGDLTVKLGLGLTYTAMVRPDDATYQPQTKRGILVAQGMESVRFDGFILKPTQPETAKKIEVTFTSDQLGDLLVNGQSNGRRVGPNAPIVVFLDEGSQVDVAVKPDDATLAARTVKGIKVKQGMASVRFTDFAAADMGQNNPPHDPGIPDNPPPANVDTTPVPFGNKYTDALAFTEANKDEAFRAQVDPPAQGAEADFSIYGDIQFNRASAFYKIGQYDDCVEALQQNYEYTRDGTVLVAKADCEYRGGKYAESLRTLRDARPICERQRAGEKTWEQFFRIQVVSYRHLVDEATDPELKSRRQLALCQAVSEYLGAFGTSTKYPALTDIKALQASYGCK